MLKIKYSLLSILCAASSISMAADYWGPNLTISTLTAYENGVVMFAVANVPPAICVYYGNHFRFDGNTNGGKQMYSMLLAAKMAGKPVNLSYAGSSMSGSTEVNGCTQETMARTWSVMIP